MTQHERTDPLAETRLVKVTSVLTGIALLLASYASVRASIILFGNRLSAIGLAVGGVGAFLFCSALLLLMPTWRRKLPAAAATAVPRAGIRLWATITAIALLLAAALAARFAGGNVLVVLPVLIVGTGLVIAFAACYILPGIIYPRRDNPIGDQSSGVPAPQLKFARMSNPVARLFVLLIGILPVIGTVVWFFAPIVPDQGVIRFLIRYGWLLVAMLTLLCTPMVVSATYTGKAGGAGKARLKGILCFACLGAILVATGGLALLPFGWNLATGAAEGTSAFLVVESTRGTGPKGCTWNLKVRPEGPTAYATMLCRVNRAQIEKAKPGDRALVHGRIGPFGMTYDAVLVIPAQ